jgi:hypothetical protein
VYGTELVWFVGSTATHLTQRPTTLTDVTALGDEVGGVNTLTAGVPVSIGCTEVAAWFRDGGGGGVMRGTGEVTSGLWDFRDWGDWVPGPSCTIVDLNNINSCDITGWIM